MTKLNVNYEVQREILLKMVRRTKLSLERSHCTHNCDAQTAGIPGRWGASWQAKSQGQDRSRSSLRFSRGALALQRQQLPHAPMIVWLNRILPHRRAATGTITWIKRHSASVGTYTRKINRFNPQLPRPHLIQRASHPEPPFHWKSRRRRQLAIRCQ
jgi:hypothetical protein